MRFYGKNEADLAHGYSAQNLIFFFFKLPYWQILICPGEQIHFAILNHGLQLSIYLQNKIFQSNLLVGGFLMRVYGFGTFELANYSLL